jgi:hypothetical protein
MEESMMIDVPEIIEQGEGKLIFELCKKYNIPTINTDGTYRHLLDILSDISSQIYKNE